MDSYIKQLLSEIGQKNKLMIENMGKLAEFSKKIYSDITGHAGDYERYYKLIKDSDDEKVTPGHLPFAVYSRPEAPKKSEEGDESEKISNVLEDRKKVFERNLETFKREAILVEQTVSEYIDLVKGLQDYYEDLIEGLKF